MAVIFFIQIKLILDVFKISTVILLIDIGETDHFSKFLDLVD